METTRQNKIARLIQKDLSKIFQEETRKTHGLLVTVSVVRVSPDLSVAKAYLSVFPSNRAEEILKNVNEQTSAIRYKLGTLERHQLRIIPEHILEAGAGLSVYIIENNLFKRKEVSEEIGACRVKGDL